MNRFLRHRFETVTVEIFATPKAPSALFCNSPGKNCARVAAGVPTPARAQGRAQQLAGPTERRLSDPGVKLLMRAR